MYWGVYVAIFIYLIVIASASYIGLRKVGEENEAKD
jgi:hypothetical protein